MAKIIKYARSGGIWGIAKGRHTPRVEPKKKY